MPLTSHPKDSIPPSVLPSGSYTSKVNDQKTENQASDTYTLDSVGNKPLGNSGETRGYAKLLKSYNKESMEDPNDYKGMSASDPLFQGTNPFASDKSDSRNVLGDRGMITRQVATYLADQALGLNTIAQEKYGVGKDGGIIGVSIQSDGAGITSNDGLLDVDYSDPRIQRGLSDLEVSDYITGQIDRHNGNIFVDRATGKVTGIDNDLGFPEVSRETLLKDPAMNMKMASGMPSVMHEETAEKIKNMDLNAYRKAISQPPPKGGPTALSPQAIEGSVARLKQLQDELNKGDTSSIKVVKAFNKQTYDEAVKKQVDSFQKTHSRYTDKENPSGTQIDKMKPSREARQAFDDCPKTSYLGKVEMTRQKNALIPENERYQVVTDTPSAKRVPQHKEMTAYQKMSPEARKTYDKNLKELNKLEARLDKLNKEVDHLQHPSLKDKISTIGRGGVEKVKQKDNTKIVNTLQDITSKKAQIKKMVDDHSPQSQDLPVGLGTKPERPKVSPVLKEGDTVRMKLSGQRPKKELNEGDTIKMPINGLPKLPEKPGKKTVGEMAPELHHVEGPSTKQNVKVGGFGHG